MPEGAVAELLHRGGNQVPDRDSAGATRSEQHAGDSRGPVSVPAAFDTAGVRGVLETPEQSRGQSVDNISEASPEASQAMTRQRMAECLLAVSYTHLRA